MINNEKYLQLCQHLKAYGSIVVAFSGGVDSTFLLKACYDALGDKVKAVTVHAPYIPQWEIEESIALAKSIGVAHEIIETGIPIDITHNPESRCYLCKTTVFSSILHLAKEQGYACVVDGSNFDDTKDYRPGLKALKELDIKSPLLEAQWTKNEIREFSQTLGLPTWDKPAYACLLTRLPYHTELKVEDFQMIEAAELIMFQHGFRAVRVRKHGDLARIEVPTDQRQRLFDVTLMDTLATAIIALGFNYVSMDLKGYRMGSFNETLTK